MSGHVRPSPSNASHSSRFSRHGFQPLPPGHEDSPPDMQSHDATIDIPLENVKTNASSAGGMRRQTSTAALRQQSAAHPSDSEKQGFLRGRRARFVGMKGTGRVGYDGEEDTLTTMGRVYRKIAGFSIITKYFFYVLPLGILLAVPIAIGAILYDDDSGNPKIGGVPLTWFFTWVEIVWCSLWVSKIVAHFLPWTFQLFVGVVSSGVRKYKTVLEKLEIPLSLVGWAVTSLATFKPLMTSNPYNRDHLKSITSNWVDIVQRLLAAILVSSLVFLAEKTIIQLISINYHRKQFNSKIKESKRHVYLLGLLYDASRALFPMYCHEFAEEDYVISDQLQLAALGGKKKHGHKRSGSATPMRLIHNVGRIGDQVTSAFGNVAKEITGREVFNPNSSHSIVVEALERKRTSEALARRIWMSFVMEGRESLFEDDILEVMGDAQKAEAEEAYWVLDRDGNGDISLDEMIMTVTEWGRERKAMANSMVDVASAINVLDGLLCAVVMVAVVFIVIAFLNTSFVTTLATAGTALLSLSFVFSVTAQEFLGSCIFLFVKHPFDVGDRIEIAGMPMTVEHISLLFCVFRRSSGPNTGQLIQYPNIVLNTLALENISRSNAMTEQITLDVSFNTSFDDIQTLKSELEKFVNDKDNSRDFQPDMNVEILGTTDMSKLQLKVEIKHKSNWANETLRASRRSRFMCALVAALRAVPIYAPGGGTDVAGSAANPNYSVAISDADAKEHAQASAAAREKARLVKKIAEAKEADALASAPSATRVGMASMDAHDATIVTQLTSRDPATDAARDEAWATGRDDSSTLGGERTSVDQSELNEVRGLLHRQSTRGKRKPGTEAPRYQQATSIPTINEPQSPTNYPSYAPPQGYDASQTTYSVPSPYMSQPTAYQSPTGGNAEMSQIGRSPSSGGYRTHRPQYQVHEYGEDHEDEDDGFGAARPFAGV